jgi:phosphate transport system substrate-binding protein
MPKKSHAFRESPDFRMAPRSDVKACAGDGVLPSSENIRSGRYPLVAPVYIATRRDISAEHPTSQLRDWILGPAGQAIVEESGYAPVETS